MDCARLKGFGRLIEVETIESHHWDFDCWPPNEGGRLYFLNFEMKLSKEWPLTKINIVLAKYFLEYRIYISRFRDVVLVNRRYCHPNQMLSRFQRENFVTAFSKN